MAQKIVIPLVLFLSAGAAVPFFLIPYERLAHTCTDPFRVMNITDFESEKFTTNLYSTVVTVFTYILPVRIDIELVSQPAPKLAPKPETVLNTLALTLTPELSNIGPG